MPSKKYYDILGVPLEASEQEIRKKYRRLVMTYHPDKNPSPDAEKKFIEIKVAYEILTGKQTEKEVKLRKSQQTAEHEKEQRVREAKIRYRDQILEEYLENDRYFKMLTKGPKWQTIRVIAIIGVFLASFLLLDYVLPRHYEPVEFTHYALNIGAKGADRRDLNIVKASNGEYYFVSGLDYQLYGEYPRGYLQTSWFFHNVISVVAKGKTTMYFYPVHFTFYSFGWLMAILFLLPSVLFFYKRKTVSFTILYHLCYYVIGGLMLVFLLTGDRWAHLITLGFL